MMVDDSSDVTFPPSGGYLQAIRESCRSCREHAKIQITHDAIERLLSSPCWSNTYKRVSALHGLALPLNFPSHLAELNLLSVLSLLNFGSGYRVPLHLETGRGAWDNMRALVFSLYLTSSVGDGDLLSSQGMRSITDVTIAELMRVNIHQERPHERIRGLIIGEVGGPVYELVRLITHVLNDTGEVLLNNGYPNLGTFIVECLKEGSKAGSPEKADLPVEIMLERIVRFIPAFRDMAIVDGKPVYCFKKALFLIHAITIRFGSLPDPPFPLPSTHHLPVFADNVLPSMLVHLGVIDLSHSPLLARLFPGAGSPAKLDTLLSLPTEDTQPLKKPPLEGGAFVTTAESYILRAAAIDACELIVEVARSRDVISQTGVAEIRLPELDMWIWSIAKERWDYRQLPRFALKDTVFF